jgi:hypothetical protein
MVIEFLFLKRMTGALAPFSYLVFIITKFYKHLVIVKKRQV